MVNANAEVKEVRGVYTRKQGSDLVSLTLRCPSCHITETESGYASRILSHRYHHCSDCGQRSFILNSDRPFGTSTEAEVPPHDPEEMTEHAPSQEGPEENETATAPEKATPNTKEFEMATSMEEPDGRAWTEERLQKEGWKLYNHARIPDEDREHIYAYDNKTLIGQFVEWLVPAHNSHAHLLMPVPEQRSFRNADHGYIGFPKAYYRRPRTNTNTEWFAFVASERAKNSAPEWFKEAHEAAERENGERRAQKSPPKESTVPASVKERPPKKVRSPLSRSQFNAALYLWILVAGALFVYGWLYLWCDAFMDLENGNGLMRSPYYNWREVFTLTFAAIIGFLAFVGLPMTVDYDEYLKKRRRQ